MGDDGDRKAPDSKIDMEALGENYGDIAAGFHRVYGKIADTIAAWVEGVSTGPFATGFNRRVGAPDARGNRRPGPPPVTNTVAPEKPEPTNPAVRKWMRDRVSSWPDDKPPPSENEDWNAAQQHFAPGLTREELRIVRTSETPAAWRKQGPRKLWGQLKN